MINTNTRKITERQLRQTAVSGSRFVPMLFSTPMVQAILDKTKTETRRVIDLKNENMLLVRKEIGNKSLINKIGFVGKHDKSVYEFVKQKIFVGDIIWVRETFYPFFDVNENKQFVYRADDDFYKDNFEEWLGWKPSLFMPKSAARIFLKVVSVSVERLHDIDEESAINEGVEFSTEFGYKLYSKNDFFSKHLSASDSYMSLWQKINGKDSWDLNPFVWVYKFQRIDEPYGFC